MSGLFPNHAFISQLDPISQASDLQYESAVNAFLSESFNPDGSLQAGAAFRPGTTKWVAYHDVRDDLADGWLIMNGTIYGIVSYPALAGRISNTYGGDGITTFAVPNATDPTGLGFIGLIKT